MLNEREGVIKFDLRFDEGDLPDVDIAAINAWRTVLSELGLIGQDPARYGGLGFGNLSMRTPSGFLITGTQTGGKAHLTLNDYAEVTSWCLAENLIEARGRVRPSSEALTHAAIYAAHDHARYVFHCHSADIWHAGRDLGMIMTDPAVPYGTPDMAREVAARLADVPCPAILSMGGHEDGIIAFGLDAQDTGSLLVSSLAAALAGRETAETGD